MAYVIIGGLARTVGHRALGSPIRNLAGGALFVLTVMAVATAAYVLAGWSAGDALYMVAITVFTVGYGEVRPIDTPLLRAITIALIWFGCTGMIFVTGALVQYITATQFSEILDVRRMNHRIDDLRDHVIVAGYGRIGSMLARELRAAGVALVVLDRNEQRCAEAIAHGHLCIRVEATEEEGLVRGGIARARALATVLPDDAANVFITLSARALNRDIEIFARGEATSTERMLLQAGASRVVLPAHISAERMAEMLLFPIVAGSPRSARAMERQVQGLGLSLEVVIAEPGSPWLGLTVQEIERQADAAFVIVELDRAGTGARERPTEQSRVGAGDGVVVIGRSARSAIAGFAARTEAALKA